MSPLPFQQRARPRVLDPHRRPPPPCFWSPARVHLCACLCSCVRSSSRACVRVRESTFAHGRGWSPVLPLPATASADLHPLRLPLRPPRDVSEPGEKIQATPPTNPKQTEAACSPKLCSLPPRPATAPSRNPWPLQLPLGARPLMTIAARRAIHISAHLSSALFPKHGRLVTSDGELFRMKNSELSMMMDEFLDQFKCDSIVSMFLH